MSDVAYILTEPNAVERVSLIKEYANHIKTIQVEQGARCEFASDWCISMPATRVQIKLSNRDKGELLVKSPRMFTHYLNDETANKDAFDEEGFYKTGDLVRRVGASYFLKGGETLTVRTLLLKPVGVVLKPN
ncbi:NRPS-like protein biosynthetic cluster [Penicillium subrubescens]|uniref:NRPS-like protein biosynthetic cluster n=1 Tax=Penicillium subrubescens TaxID=1316194 RepID=UPI002545696D|nr:NRPS-like protein biosynthetic cluster [Penicillium subrubescens]KAJ5900264.1 NRPS-like protein biosynthetic cluster [Penicillium subrubescens]